MLIEYCAPEAHSKKHLTDKWERFMLQTNRCPLAPRSLAVLHVVGGEVGGDELARAVRVDVAVHVVLLLEHLLAHVVEARGRYLVALAIDLPRDRRVARAHVVVARGAGGRAGVDAHVGALVLLLVDDHALDEVHVDIFLGLVVDDGEDLRLHADLLEGVERGDRDDAVAAEDAVVEGRLHLPLGAARAGGRVRPVDLVRLAHVHVRAVLPVVLRHLRRRHRLVVVALEARAHRCRLVGRTGACHLPRTRVERRRHAAQPFVGVAGAAGAARAAGAVGRRRELAPGLRRRSRRAGALLVILADREVLGAQVPVHVDRAEAGVRVLLGDGRAALGVEEADEALGHVAAGLLERLRDAVHHALRVGEVAVARASVVRLLARARVGAVGERVGFVVEAVVGREHSH
eukprot:scaffold28770_cov64-Phaeocystis_antarctica.AAC.6